MPDDSLIDEMRAALRGDRERAENRHHDGAGTERTVAPGGEQETGEQPEGAPVAPPRGLRARIAALRAGR